VSNQEKMMKGTFVTILGLLATIILFSPQCVSALKCYSCNSAIKGQEDCKEITKDSNKYLVPCTKPDDYKASQCTIMKDIGGSDIKPVQSWGRSKEDFSEACNMSENPDEKVQITAMKPEDGKSIFVCRKIFITIPYSKIPKGKQTTEERVVRLCGILGEGKPKEETKCLAIAGSQGTQIMSCPCNTDNCNAAGISGGSLNIILVIVAAVGVLLNSL